MMNNIKKSLKLLPVIICLAAVLIGSLCISAASKLPLVVDNANILTAGEEAKLTSKLESIGSKYGQDIVVVTTNTLDGKRVQAYADDFFDYNGYGVGDSRSGILLLISVESSEYAISTCGDAIEIFNENDLSSLEDAFWKDLHNGNYYNSFDAFADKCEHIIKYDKRLSPIWIVISLLVGAAIAAIVVAVMCSKHKSVKAQRAADSYIRGGQLDLTRSRDVYLYSKVTYRAKPQNNSSINSTTRTGSSGRSHGGRSGRF